MYLTCTNFRRKTCTSKWILLRPGERDKKTKYFCFHFYPLDTRHESNLHKNVQFTPFVQGNLNHCLLTFERVFKFKEVVIRKNTEPRSAMFDSISPGGVWYTILEEIEARNLFPQSLQIAKSWRTDRLFALRAGAILCEISNIGMGLKNEFLFLWLWKRIVRRYLQWNGYLANISKNYSFTYFCYKDIAVTMISWDR